MRTSEYCFFLSYLLLVEKLIFFFYISIFVLKFILNSAPILFINNLDDILDIMGLCAIVNCISDIITVATLLIL